ncbi:Crp/Fnr family transcriptional regulator [Dyadobacter sp. CY345]|uniref:Crp/Fnr family transcriptional regulator n=1 Tax=Dyadobacter sp. CY345 TaxID=2909335 RepID=UPI001F3A4A01|nr:Crp/Fnr family transcriptional regulator [Dyadobacter sp. CY345]MCF2446092.1 Crp/Fnr family transcriptional regulator [Dyadobacter sp. CY345]
MKDLLQRLELHIPLPTDVVKFLNNRAAKRNFRARVQILMPNENQKSLLFLTKGITRNFYRTESKEWTSRFSQAGDFVVSVDNFLLNLPCQEYIETCTPIEFIEIPKIDYLQILTDNPELYIALSNIMIENFKATIDRMCSWQMQSATERYHAFIQQYPIVHQQVQQQHIASYLGITPTGLSRIRKQKGNEYLL